MANEIISILVIITCFWATKTTSSDVKTTSGNSIDEEINPFAEAAAAILQEQNAQNIGGILNNIVQSGGAKQIGDMLMNAATNENTGQILQGLGSMLGGAQGQFDPSILGNVLSSFMQTQNQRTNNEEHDSNGFDFASLLTLVGPFLGNTLQAGNEGRNLLDLVPVLLQSYNAFMGPEAEKRAKGHEEHAALVPPVLERVHVMFDHFVHSDLGKQIINTIGAEKFMKIFSDENGKFSYMKFVDMMENHSFRRHWIRLVTNRIASFLSYLSDPNVQQM